MIKCWSENDIPKRHTRQYCIDEYDISFVRNELPSLLRRDGLPKEEVVRLTKDDPNMEPPTPHPYWKDRDESDLKCEDLGDSQSENDADSNVDSNEDSDDELSDDWQTAEED